MKLRSGKPFWAIRNGLPASYPRLQGSLDTEVAVIGAGITGAIVAARLIDEGRDVVMLDGREVACGSTSASTGLIQYEIDTPLTELARRYGEPGAVAAFRACLQAIDALELLDGSTGGAGHFQPRPSFYQASTPDDVPDLRVEFALRERHGFPVELWDARQIAQHFDFAAPLGILSRAGAELDPHGLTHALLAKVAARGAVFDRTRVTAMAPQEAAGGGIRLVIEDGDAVVTCREVVVAAGYESLRFLPPLKATLHSTFALISEPLTAFPGWYERCLIWETARPYLYMRTTDDDRLLAGGQDCAFRRWGNYEALYGRRLRRIEAEVRRRFPRLDFAVDYAWAGTFAETFDGLPFIGRHARRPGALFALCFGGNGIVYSVIAADMIAAELNGTPHPLRQLFGFGRGGT